jgi:hypothetical protein
MYNPYTGERMEVGESYYDPGTGMTVHNGGDI